MSNDDNGESLRALFHGLCSYWGIDARPSEDPGDPYDFTLRATGMPVYVVILPEPEDRQVEIATLHHYGDRVLVLDRTDLENLRRCADEAGASFVISHWLRNGTSATAERARMGIRS
jgi:hypothetical protein